MSKTYTIMNPAITKERLLELGGSLNGILQELSAAVEAPAPNPRKRRNLKQARVAKYLNMIDAKIAKSNIKKQGLRG